MINIFSIAVVLMLVVKFLVDFIAEMLNRASLNREVPNEFREVFDREGYRKSQDYTAITSKFRLLNSFLDLALLFVFWFAGGFNLLDIYVRGFGLNFLFTGLMYIGILAGANFLISLPFEIYSTFVIEARFGLNRTTIATFILDRIKGILLGTLIGGAMLTAILCLFEIAGAYAWFYAWVAVSAITAFLMFIGPRFLMPIFFKFTPLEDGELKTEIYALAEKLNFPLSGIFVIDGSRRSAKSNAFFAGFGKHKRIALFDTLIAGNTVSESVAVLAHEIGHYKKKHAISGLITDIWQRGFMFFIFSLVYGSNWFFAAFGIEHKSVYLALVLFMIAYGFVVEIFSVFNNVVSRKHEREADRYSVDATNKPQDLIDGLKKLAKNNLSNLEPHPFYVFLNYSHPPLLERFRKIREHAGRSN